MARLAELCDAEAPHLAACTLEAATAFVERALRIDGPFVELDFALQARPATLTVSVACRKIIGTVLGIFTAGLVVPSPARIAESVAAVARDVFGDREQECEACHGARAEVYERRARIRHATRHLLKLVQPQLALDGDEPLSETVAAVLTPFIRSGPVSCRMRDCTEPLPLACVRACTRPCLHSCCTRVRKEPTTRE